VSAPHAHHRRRWLIASLCAVAILVIAVVVIRSIVLRDSAHAVPADQALAIFREESSTSTTSTPATTTAAPTTSPVSSPASTPVTAPVESSAAPPATPQLMEPGIYRYATTGSEQIDALGGTSHDYPAETTITVIDSGCGVSLRWDALRERREEWALCATPDGIELQPDGDQYHEFYSQPDDEAVACEQPVVIVPTDVASNDGPQMPTCTLGSDPWRPTWTVLERTTRSVDGTDIGVQHVRMTVEDGDEYYEHTVVDWYLTDSGLPAEITSTKESRTPSPVGGVVYREQYDLKLESTTPLQ
jgi:hypothetical protein